MVNTAWFTHKRTANMAYDSEDIIEIVTFESKSTLKKNFSEKLKPTEMKYYFLE